MLRRRIAKIVSAALNAPLFVLISFISLILSSWSSVSPLILLTAAVFGSALPLAAALCMVKMRVIPDVYASELRSRAKPITVAVLSYTAGLLALLLMDAPRGVTAFMASYLVNATVLLFVSLIWKISIHASGVAGPVTALVYQLGARMLPLFLLVIPVAWARLELKAHDYKQVAAGAALASGLTWLQMSLFTRILLF